MFSYKNNYISPYVTALKRQIITTRQHCKYEEIFHQRRIVHTAAFTLDVYGHVTDQMHKESTVRMDRFIKNVLSG